MPAPREETPLEQPVERPTAYPKQPVLTGLDAGLIGAVRPPNGPAPRVSGAVAGRTPPTCEKGMMAGFCANPQSSVQPGSSAESVGIGRD